MLPAPHKPDPASWSDDELTVAWLGHATVLINFYGTWLLTDPALRARIGVRVGPTLTVGVNGSLVAVDSTLHEGDKVMLVTPMEGG